MLPRRRLQRLGSGTVRVHTRFQVSSPLPSSVRCLWRSRGGPHRVERAVQVDAVQKDKELAADDDVRIDRAKRVLEPLQAVRRRLARVANVVVPNHIVQDIARGRPRLCAPRTVTTPESSVSAWRHRTGARAPHSRTGSKMRR
jgi:hypothetical protein